MHCNKNQLEACAQLTLRRDLVTATAASSAIGSVMMGLGANLPVAVAPGMGLNAYVSPPILHESFHSTSLSQSLLMVVVAPDNDFK